jgi:hypothetical protein
MMGCRVGSQTVIAASEWAVVGRGGIAADDSPVRSDAIAITLCDVAGNDMDFGAWLVQEHVPALAGWGMRKFLASTGAVRHAVLHTRTGRPAPPPAFADPGTGEWGAKVAGYLSCPLGRPAIVMQKVSP